jgi:hypothetical protein
MAHDIVPERRRIASRRFSVQARIFTLRLFPLHFPRLFLNNPAVSLKGLSEQRKQVYGEPCLRPISAATGAVYPVTLTLLV